MKKEKHFDPAAYLDMEPGYYDSVFQRGRGIQWFWHQQRLLRVRNSLPRNCERVVDLGCGSGTFLGNFFDESGYALGIDLAGPQIEYAQRRYRRPGLEFREGDVTRFTSDLPFDAAVSIEVIEHLHPGQTQTFLGTLRNLLNPNGTLVLVTPNYRSLWPITEWFVSKIGPVNYLAQHINPFTRRRLISEVEKAGFKVTDCRSFFVLAPFLVILSSKVAEIVLALEQRIIPSFGSELLLIARKPP